MRHLLDEDRPADAMAAYYAFYHPDEKTQLITYPVGAPRASSYVVLSRTGMDLFRPLVTLRLPITDLTTSADVIYQALQPGAAVILSSPARYTALLQALFASQTEELLRLYVLDPNRFQPIINVLVTQSTSPNNWPRFIIRRSEPGNDEVVAAAGLNWLSPRYAEISVNTAAHYQRQGWGRSVVAAMAEHLLKNGRTPLYAVSEKNEASIRLAESVGFVASGVRETLIQGTLKPRP
jgi:RimJ/RimL family protein N-acetyltransferase